MRVASISYSVMVPPNDAVQLIYAVAKNPVMVGVDANTWPNPYGGGIFKMRTVD